jgi:hypothetical protein
MPDYNLLDQINHASGRTGTLRAIESDWAQAGVTPTNPEFRPAPDYPASGNYAGEVSETPTSNPGYTAPNGRWYPSFAAYEGERLAQLRASIDAARGAAVGRGRTAIGDVGNSFENEGLSLIEQIRLGQGKIDRSRENTAINRSRGMADVADSVRSGLQGLTVRLSNNNAMDSSAAGAGAQAYGKWGTKQRGAVQNQAFMEGREQDFEQESLDVSRGEGVRRLRTYKDTEARRISDEVRTRLADLAAEAAAGGLAPGFDLESEVRAAIADGEARLAALDQDLLGTRLGGIRGLSPDEIEANAHRLGQEGYVPSSGFDYESAPEVGVGPTAPISQLPIFTRRRRGE